MSNWSFWHLNNIQDLIYINCFLLYCSEVWCHLLYMFYLIYIFYTIFNARLHLFDQKYCEIVLQFKMTGFYFIMFWNVIYLWPGKAEFSAAITPVFSVTWFLRNHSNNLLNMWKSWYTFDWCNTSLMNVSIVLFKIKWHFSCRQPKNSYIWDWTWILQYGTFK